MSAMPGLLSIPSLDELAADPSRAAALPAEAFTALLTRCTLAQSALLARLLAAGSVNGPPGRPPTEPDRLLTAEQAAAILAVTPRRLKERACKLPFARKLSHRVVRYAEAALRRWQAARGA